MKRAKPKRKLTNIRPEEVSVVDSPANMRGFLLLKSTTTPDRLVGKPYPGEHAARIHDPGSYDRFRRDNDKFGKGIDAIFGIKEDGTTEVQSIRFDSDSFTADEAKSWLKDNDYSPIEFEEAKEKEEKASFEVTVASDGTTSGTSIKINGEEVPDINNFYLSVWAPSMDNPNGNLDCSYTRVVEAEDGFARTENYTLYKGESKMDEKLVKVLKAFFGEDYKVVKAELSEEEMKELQDAVAKINEYKEDMPEDLATAVGILIKYATKQNESMEEAEGGEGGGTEESAEKKDEKKKAEKKTNTDNKGDENIAKMLTEALEKNQKATTDLITAKFGELEGRLSKVEKTAAVKKGIDGQEDETDDGADPDDHFSSVPL